MKPAAQLNVVLKVNQAKETSAGRYLQECQQQCLHAEQQLQQLFKFQADYQQQATGPHVNIQQLQMMSNFLSQLGQAIEQQQQQLVAVTRQWQQAQQQWQQAHQETRKVEQLQARLAASEQVRLTRREQRLLDEWVMVHQSRQH
ncbi:flagellar export protein FliJ [Endozoicomonas sp. SM1973]|uniref:Flagellar FliJ protein n=1 Tax=Spartinivicinus marinus TaxID=2994442 RepID=A0A853I227_9GAMM|nr:flagellar export protein FliJ [Spartinivicinus marinus]MCX4028895.1 flagellar export protein FliJ [Spartinivicinus marinus]NYZ65522.1 flagellar export protein FliJ [Spartinivicinus marinus]